MEKKMVTTNNALPRWLKFANRFVVALERLGLPLGTIHVLSVPGRKSGKLRTTPVSLMAAFASLTGFGIEGYRLAISGLAAKIGAKKAN